MRYMCRAHLADPHELQIGRRKVETRFCPNDGTVVCETDGGLNLENKSCGYISTPLHQAGYFFFILSIFRPRRRAAKNASGENGWDELVIVGELVQLLSELCQRLPHS
ncbi:hypothetical protein GOODEAATRI_024477 [Goodea atripinnis]|uniref:Sema5A/B-like TSP-1 type 1 domain-containing protein n=1 Tax=Goodea atripinnis TaxID=208336 RepID=A0ABV0MVJ0_9TELE